VIELSDKLAIDGGTPTAPNRIPIANPVVPKEALRTVNRLLRAGQLREGEVTRQFERDFAGFVGVRHAYAVASGTAALHLAYAAVLHPGDEVLVPAFTFFATAACVVHAGGVPVPVDIDLEMYTLDPRAAEARITPRTRAVAPVHLYGQPADMTAINQLALRHGLAVIADAAQAHGARLDGRDVATLATISAYSTYVTKNLFTGEGGLVTTDDDALGQLVELLRSHGSRKKYVHELFGFNYRLSEPAAAIGLAQIGRLERDNEIRNRNARQLTQALSKVPGIVPPRVRPGALHVFHQYTIRVQENRFRVDRDTFASALRAEGVDCAVHYPVTVNRQPAWIERFGEGEAAPMAELASREVLSLPVHPGVTRAQCAEIALAVEKVARHYRS
jgi:perosamine synthetase